MRACGYFQISFKIGDESKAHALCEGYQMFHPSIYDLLLPDKDCVMMLGITYIPEYKDCVSSIFCSRTSIKSSNLDTWNLMMLSTLHVTM